MNKLRSNIWFAIVLLFTAGLVWLTFYHIVESPWRIMTELGGDGAKNNFTYLYQCTFGKGYWFNGMNYPYGEHIVYADGQPLLSVPFTFLKNKTYGDALTVMWLLISFSFFLSIVVIYRILTHFKLAPLAAMLFAGLIGVFSPQLFRIQGHYGLSYVCIIPLLFWWNIKYMECFHWRYPVYFFIAGCLMAFIHPYYIAMMLVWVMSFSVGYFIFIKEGFGRRLRHTLPLIGSVVAVAGVVAIVMKLTDPITDRPANPFNSFYDTCTHIKQLISSVHSPFWQKASGKPRFYFVSDGGEGFAYTGLVVGITLAISIAVGIKRYIKSRHMDAVYDTAVFSPVWLFMAFAALVFSMGVPFIWHLEWLFDYVSFFRQFRSLGRFSWIFYYIAAVYTAVAVYGLYAKYVARKKLFAGYAVLILALGLWSYEASGYIGYYRRLSWFGLYNYDQLFSTEDLNWPQFLEQHHYSADKFQAVMMLPFFHVGTEKLWVGGDPSWLITLSSKAALQLHLPIIDVMMSRSSWSVAMKQVKTVGGPYTDKPALRELPDNKAFLLMRFEETHIDRDQEYLLQASDSIGHFSQCYIYACYPDRIKANDKKNADSVQQIVSAMKSADTVIANDGVCYYNHYDADRTAQHIFGAGGGPVIHGNDTILATVPLTVVPKDSELYEFSCWFLVNDKDYRTPYVTIQLLNDSGRVVAWPDALTKQSTDNKGLWLRSSVFFYVHSNCRNIRVKLMNIPHPAYLAMDELLLRPAGALVISKGADGQLMVNNHLFQHK